MKYEKLVQTLNQFGFHQKKVLLLLCLPAITCCWHKFVWVFIGAIPAHRCRLPFEDRDAGVLAYNLPESVLNMSIPWDAARGRWHQCIRLNATFDADYFAGGVPSDQVVSCRKDYVFDTSRHQTSVPMTWNLVCQRMILPATTHTIFYIGVLLGSVGYGAMADKFGRRPALAVALTSLSVGGLISGVVPDYFSFTSMRMVIGGSASGVFIVSLVLAMEMVGPFKRVFVGSAFQSFFALGYMLLALLAYFLRDWHSLQVTISATGLFFISYYWLIPESARWLFQRQRTDEAERIVARIAKENGAASGAILMTDKNVDHGDDNHSQVKLVTEKFKVMDLFGTPDLCKKSLIIFFIWMVTSGVYYGLAIYTLDLGDDDYASFVTTAIIEFIAYTISLFTVDRYGRRATLCSSLVVGGCVLLLISLFSDDRHSMTMITLATVGRFGLAFAYNVIYIFSVELFPTVVRCVGLGSSSAMARVGGIISSYILLLKVYWKPLPVVIFGVLSIAAGLLAWQLPETTGRDLPETVQEHDSSIHYSTGSEPSQNVEIMRSSNGTV